MTDAALNPVAPSRAHTRNESLRPLASKQFQNCPALGVEQTLAILTSQHLARSGPCQTQKETLSEPGSPIQIP